ncbi:hypothetical protein EV652_106120 [Kribbella steppae]|uniref:Uncharacterized protein n=1 Tax=Kribbella steppae TaxID=2512223 RepID=A0A4R2HGQ5_9ACTN|nr:hypothetical protein EV652_106120 [Kribbella steppae]
MPSGSSAVRAAPISEPSSIVPVVSTVTETITGMVEPAASSALRAPITLALVCSRSWVVSTRIASAPPSISPRAVSAYASRKVVNVV